MDLIKIHFTTPEINHHQLLAMGGYVPIIPRVKAHNPYPPPKKKIIALMFLKMVELKVKLYKFSLSLFQGLKVSKIITLR